MRYSVRAFILFIMLSLLLTVTGDASATSMVLAQNSSVDLSVSEATQDGINDLKALSCNCPTATSLRLLNGAERAWSSSSYDNSTFAQAQVASYSTGDFIPSEGDVMFIKTGNSHFYKMRPTGQNDGSGIGIEFDYLGSGLPPAPSASFTYSSLDLIASFTDTSTGDAVSWSWTFDDGGTSTYKNPTHVYASAGTYNVCLTSSNAGGDSTPSCQNVTVSEVPSTLVAPGSSIDFNSDGTNDILVSVNGACGSSMPNSMSTINGAQYSWIGGNYDSTTVTDAQNASYGSGSFCGSEADINDTIVVKTSNNGFIKFWTPANNSNGIRFQYEVLEGGLPPVPVASFTSSSIDLITGFTDTSTNTPTGWSWTFGDGGTSTSKNPYHTYASAGTYNVCLTPSNAGGSGTQVCQNVTVSQVPSTSLNAGDKIDVNGDGVDDLQAYTCNCPASMGLSVLNFAEWGSVGKAYSAVTLTDAQNASYGTSNFVQENGDYDSPSVIRTGTGALVKMWAPVNDNGTVRLQVEVLAGGGTPPDPPVASFTNSPSGLNVNFTDTSTNTPTSWTWDFGDTGTSTLRNPSHTFADTGTFNVCLTAANAGGSDTTCQNVSVTKPPTADFNFSVDGQDVDFTDASTDAPTSWSWDFDDTNSSIAQSPSHTFASGGTYNVCLTATNAGGSDVQCRSVTVYGVPTAFFTFGTNGLTATFADTSTSVPTSWLWDFGDGVEATSTSQNPSHAYADSGTYNVCLTATNGSGSSAPACQNVTVVRPPTASFTFVAAGLTVNFTDTSTESPTNWGWNFGDSNVSSLQNPSHAFADTGTYNVCLTATNAGGSSTAACQDVSVVKPPTAAFTFVVTGMDVNFTDTSTGGPTGWLWDFGDSSSSTSQNASHSYVSAGTYNVCLTASNTGGTGSTQTCQNVTIDPAPIASFTYQADNLNVNFTDTSTDAPTSWLWDFGDGETTSTQQNPSHTYAAVGSYTVCLMATNPSGSNQTCQTLGVTAGAPQLVNPTGTITDFSPTFEWSGPVAATWYRVYITKASVVILDQWYEVGNSAVACTSGNCTFEYTLASNGEFTWYIYGYGPFGYTEWSSAGNFVLNTPAPNVVNRTVPSDGATLAETSVSFEWDHDANATWYEIWVGTGTTADYNEWHAASSDCTGATCSMTTTLSHGVTYTWYIRAYGPGSYGDWSAAFTFTINVPAPGAITITAPMNTIATSTPLLKWDHDAAATWYQVWVGNSADEAVFYEWVDATTACAGATCSLDTGLTFIGSFKWYIRGWSPGGYGPWSTEMDFSYVVGLNSPTGTVNGVNITYNWSDAGSTTTWYRLWAGTTPENITILNQWVDASVVCNGATCSYTHVSTQSADDYIWYVQPYGPSYEYGPWSTGQNFTVSVAPRQESLPSGILESNDASVESNGVWQAQNTASASGSSYLYSSGDENDVLVVEFYGTSVEIVYVTHPAFGSFAIDIDNNIYRTVVTTGDATTFDNRAVVNYLEEGYHTLRIYSVDGVIAIDAFIVE